MEKAENNKVLLTLLVFFIVLSLVLGGYIIYDKILSDDTNNVCNDSQNIINNDKQIDEVSQKEYTEEELKGLELYKLMIGTGSGPFIWENGEVINYDEVMSRMTKAYIESFSNSGGVHGFSIPVYEDGIWKSYGGYGTEYESYFKDIKTVSITGCTIDYEIIYMYKKMGSDDAFSEGKDEFSAKMCSEPEEVDYVDSDFSNGYKVENFDLIFGLQFE